MNGQDAGNGASQVGIMVHEIAHVAGAWIDTPALTLNEDALVTAAVGSFTMSTEAEAYRFFVMNTHF